jgi:hypothetical protein
MDKYYGNVCELDIIFSFTKAYYILDELLLAGELQESSKKNVLRCIGQQDSLEDMEVSGDFYSTSGIHILRLDCCIARLWRASGMINALFYYLISSTAAMRRDTADTEYPQTQKVEDEVTKLM